MRFIKFIFAVAICGFVIALIGDEHLRHNVFGKVELWIEEIREVTHDDEYSPESSSGDSEFTSHSGSSSIAPDDILGRVIDDMSGVVGRTARDSDDEVEGRSDANIDRYQDADNEAFGMAREATRDFSQRDSVRGTFIDFVGTIIVACLAWGVTSLLCSFHHNRLVQDSRLAAAGSRDSS